MIDRAWIMYGAMTVALALASLGAVFQRKAIGPPWLGPGLRNAGLVLLFLALVPSVLDFVRAITTSIKDGWLAAAIMAPLLGLFWLSFVTTRSRQRRLLEPLRAILDKRLQEAETVYSWNEHGHLAGHVRGQPVHFALAEGDEEQPSEFRIAIASEHPVLFKIERSKAMEWADLSAWRRFRCGIPALDDPLTFRWMPGSKGEVGEQRVVLAFRRPEVRQAIERLLALRQLARVSTEVLPDGSGGTFPAIQLVYSPYLREHMTIENVRSVFRHIETLRDAIRNEWRESR